MVPLRALTDLVQFEGTVWLSGAVVVWVFPSPMTGARDSFGFISLSLSIGVAHAAPLSAFGFIPGDVLSRWLARRGV